MTTIPCLVLAAAGALCASCPAGPQRRDAKPTAVEPLRVEIVCDAEGERIARVPGAAPAEGDNPQPPFALRGRAISWRVGPRRFTKLRELRDELERVHADPRRRVPDPRSPGQRRPPPLVLVPGPKARYDDVVTTFNAALWAGFEVIRLFDGQRFTYLVPKGIDEPFTADWRMVVPQADFNEPDDRPAEGRPTIEVHQDGRVLCDGQVAYDPRRHGDDHTSIRMVLIERKVTAREQGLVAKRDVQPYRDVEALTVPVLILADRWAEWRIVRAVIEACSHRDVLFWKMELGVGEYDFEKKLREDREFREEHGPRGRERRGRDR